MLNIIDNRDYTKELDINENIIINDGLKYLHRRLQNNQTVNGTVELLDAHFILDPEKPYLDFGDLKKASRDYIEKEFKWYTSKDRSINGGVGDVKIWQQVCSKDGKYEVNSNYGWCIYSEENDNQYAHALDSLVKDKFSRQSTCIYTRPSIQTEWNENGKHDMICTFCTQHFIRDDIVPTGPTSIRKATRLHYIVNMRSNDAIFGFMNDFAWHCIVYQQMFKDLQNVYPELEFGNIHWNAGSWHIYERHYDLLKQIIEKYGN